MPCDNCRHGERCFDQADFSREWVFDFYVRGQRRECVGYEPRWFRGIEGVAA